MAKNTRHHLVRLVALLLSVSILATACGGADSGDTNSAQNSAGNPGDVAAQPILDPAADPTDPGADDPDAEAGGDDEGDDDPNNDGDERSGEEITLPGDVIIDAPGIVIDDSGDEPVVQETAVGELELPITGVLEQLWFAAGLEGRIGTAKGAELEHLDAHLRPDVTYWYVIMEKDNVLSVEWGDVAIDFPRDFSMPGGGRSILVVDPVDLYIYVGTACPGINSPINIDLQLSAYEGGCGIGISADGTIPVDFELANEVNEEFAGIRPQFVIDGEVPVPYGSVVGSVFVDLDPNGLMYVVEGQYSLGLPGKLGKGLPVSLPIGQATVGVDRRVLDPTASSSGDIELKEQTWVSGYVGEGIIGTGDFADVLDFIGPEANVEVDAFIHRTGGALGWTYEPDTFVDLEGEASLSVAHVMPDDLNDKTFQAAFEARLDSTGLVGSAEVQASPIPSIDLSGSAQMAFEYKYENRSDAFFELTGDFQINGTELIEGRLRIDRNGAVAEGRVGVGSNFVALSGAVTTSGVQLTGEVSVSIDLTNLDGLAAKIAGDFGEDETIDRIEAEIDELAPHAAVQKLLDDVDEAYRKTAINNDKIDDHEDDLDDLKTLWDSYTGLQKIGKSVSHAAQVAFHETAIAGLKTANATHWAVIKTLDSIVGLYEKFFDPRPVDVERFEALKDLLRKLKWERLWANIRNVIAGVVRGAAWLLDAFNIDPALNGKAIISLGTEGFYGELDVEFCNNGKCDSVIGGTVALPQGEACATFVGATGCVRL